MPKHQEDKPPGAIATEHGWQHANTEHCYRACVIEVMRESGWNTTECSELLQSIPFSNALLFCCFCSAFHFQCTAMWREVDILMCPQSEVYKKSALNYYCWHAPNSDVVDGRSVTLPQTAASYWGLPHACLLLCGTHNVLCVPFFLAIPWPQDSPTAADSVIRQ